MKENYTKANVELNGAYLFYIPIDINIWNVDILETLKAFSQLFSVSGILKWVRFLRKKKFSWIDIMYSIDLFIGIKRYKFPVLKIMLFILLGYLIIK